MTTAVAAWCRPVAAALAATAATVAGAAAWGSPPPPAGRVVVLRPPDASPLAQHCLTRIRDELVAAGFEVSISDPGAGRDPVSVATVMKRQEGAIATIALLGDPDQPGAELWILDRVTAHPEVRRLPAPAYDRERLPEVLAIRTTEVLMASALKLLVESSPAAAPEPAPVATIAPPTPAPAARARILGLETGISALESVGGPGPAALPLVRVRLWLADRLFARLTLAALGSRPRVTTAIGSASVSQSLGLAELGAAFRPGQRWRPVLGLGAGAFHVRTEGEGVWPYEGVRASHWAVAVEAGAGLMTHLGGDLSLGIEAHGLVVLAPPSVRFHQVEPVTIGYPAVLVSLTVIGWL